MNPSCIQSARNILNGLPSKVQVTGKPDWQIPPDYFAKAEPLVISVLIAYAETQTAPLQNEIEALKAAINQLQVEGQKQISGLTDLLQVRQDEIEQLKAKALGLNLQISSLQKEATESQKP